MKVQDQKLTSSASSKRIFELDALRGVAAVVVMFHHLRFMFHMEPPRWFLRPLFDGHAAVFLFFSLSGYVLSLAYWKGKQLPYGLYLLRRFFRIYVPYAVACIVAVAVGRHLLYAQLPLTQWFYFTWHAPINLKLIAQQLFTMYTGPEINTAFWSLRYEMEMSIIFPGLCAFLMKLHPVRSLAFGLCCLVAGLLTMKYAPNDSTLMELGATFSRGSCFVFGALAAWQKPRIDIVHANSPKPVIYTLLVSSLICLWSTYDLLIIPASCMIVIFAQEGRARDWLNKPLPEYLGKVSYSLYLLHGTILFASFILLYKRFPVWAVVLTYFIFSFVASHLFNLMIEMPADRYGKYLASVIARNRAKNQSV